MEVNKDVLKDKAFGWFKALDSGNRVNSILLIILIVVTVLT